MATYLLFGKYTPESVKAISVKRTKDAATLIKKNGGELKEAYALLGDVDLLFVVSLPDTPSAMKTSVALTKQMGIAFRTAPAVTVGEFDKLVG